MSNEGFDKWICVDHRTYVKRGSKYYTPTPPRCPKCAKDMKNMGKVFEVPPKKDKKAWDKLKERAKSNG